MNELKSEVSILESEKKELESSVSTLTSKVTEFNEKHLLNEINLGLKQYIILASGYDTSGFKVNNKLKIFELDKKEMIEDKMNIIKESNSEGKKVCMIGDGINDALALSSAYTGIAMGGVGSDIAVESADAVLVQDDISNVPYFFELSKRVYRKIKFNIVFAIGLNTIAVVLASTGILNPILGAIVHNCGSVFVVVNSATLLINKNKYTNF